MKKKEYEYDYMFDWVLKKSKLKDLPYKEDDQEEDYKQILREALEGKPKKKEEMNNKYKKELKREYIKAQLLNMT